FSCRTIPTPTPTPTPIPTPTPLPFSCRTIPTPTPTPTPIPTPTPLPYMYPRFLQLIIRKQVGNLSTHTTKYTSPALTQKVFANMRRVGKVFFRVETPLFQGMLVAQEIDEEWDADEHVEEVNNGDADEGDDDAAHGEVLTVAEVHTISYTTYSTTTTISRYPFNITCTTNTTTITLAMDACAALTRRVDHLEYDKVAQALEITKLKRRVKKLEKRNKDDAVKEVADAIKDVEKAKRVFANMRSVGKVFFGVETPLFQGMLVAQEIDEEWDADEHVEEVNNGDADEGDDSAAHGEVLTVAEVHTISYTTYSTTTTTSRYPFNIT
nr:hypothetical protein [Tanacetum cinerariifolium]